MVETRLQLKRLRNNIYYRDIDYNEVVVMSTHPHQTKKKKKHHNNNNRREDKQMKAAARRQKKANQGFHNGNDDFEDDYVSLREQLRQNGMTLRRIEGDGNCLFRAFSDQIHGDQSLHKELRKKVTEFMKEQRDDFEPFVVDSDFDKHLRLLAQDGTYGGNDSIVAFSRLQGVSVVIHQLNEALWRVDPAENTPAETEIHISYHNGDHYNSVRHLDEKRGLKIPAGIRIQTTPKSKHKDYNKKQNENDKIRIDDDLIDMVMENSGLPDKDIAREALKVNHGCAEAAVDYILNSPDLLNPMWRPGGTADRILGGGAELVKNKQHTQSKKKANPEPIRLSNKERKRLNRQNKQQEGKKSQSSDESESDPNTTPIVTNLQTLSI